MILYYYYFLDLFLTKKARAKLNNTKPTQAINMPIVPIMRNRSVPGNTLIAKYIPTTSKVTPAISEMIEFLFDIGQIARTIRHCQLLDLSLVGCFMPNIIALRRT
jgi:hypothetical protein